MSRHAIEQLLRISECFDSEEQLTSTSQLRRIHPIPHRQYEEPCFATGKRSCCGKNCEWREDCRAMLAVWLCIE